MKNATFILLTILFLGCVENRRTETVVDPLEKKILSIKSDHSIIKMLLDDVEESMSDKADDMEFIRSIIDHAEAKIKEIEISYTLKDVIEKMDLINSRIDTIMYYLDVSDEWWRYVIKETDIDSILNK